MNYSPKIGIYPGSFDPTTLGHLDIMLRSLGFIDTLFVAVGHNSTKDYLFCKDERLSLLKESIENHFEAHQANCIKIESFSGLLSDYAKERHANIVIRGVRALSDFDFEFSLAGIHQATANLETVFLFTSGDHYITRSSIIKDIARLGGDVSSFVPTNVFHALAAKYSLS